MDDIFLLQADPRAAAVLAGSLAPPVRVRVLKGFAEVERLLRKTLPQACVLDVFDSPVPVPLNSLGMLRRRYPTLGLVVASDFKGREMDLYHLGRMSVEGVIRMDSRPSAREILAVVDKAIAASLATRVILHCARDHTDLAQEILRWAIEHADARPQVSDLAMAVGMSPRVLNREMRVLDLPSPRDLLLWGRLIRASHLLERSFETVESVAFRLGYSTGGALGKALKHHVGCSPTDLVEGGGLDQTLGIFQRTVLHSPG